jgi:hypothetical protein
MALNMDKIKARLATLENKGKKASQNNKSKDSIWKPQPGKQVIRIVPNQYQPDDPFTQLKFHYDFGGKTLLSPSSFGKADPIVELSERLKKSKDTWAQGRQLEPKLRTYVPVIVRGEEDKGVRFWAFGVTIYKQLMQTMSEPDYGDITSLTEGYDIQVEYKTKEEAKKDFPETTIMVKPKPRPVIDPTLPNAKAIVETITTKQPNILEVFETPSYETLQAALEAYLAGGTEESTDSTPSENATTTVPVAEVKAASASDATPASASPTAAKATTNAEELTNAFQNLFDN